MRNFGSVEEETATSFSIRDRIMEKAASRRAAGVRRPPGTERTGEYETGSGRLMRGVTGQMQRQQGSQLEARIAQMEMQAVAAQAKGDESFFSRFRVPLILTGAVTLAGGLYYGFVIRPRQAKG